MEKELRLGVDALSTMKKWSSAIQVAINHTVCPHMHICMHPLNTVNIIKLFSN